MFSKILKANPFRAADGKFTTESGNVGVVAAKPSGPIGGIPPGLKPAFSGRKKININDAKKALEDQGYAMEHYASTPDGVTYKVTDKKGKSFVVSGSDLTKALTGKGKKSLDHPY